MCQQTADVGLTNCVDMNILSNELISLQYLGNCWSPCQGAREHMFVISIFLTNQFQQKQGVAIISKYWGLLASFSSVWLEQEVKTGGDIL